MKTYLFVTAPGADCQMFNICFSGHEPRKARSFLSGQSRASLGPHQIVRMASAGGWNSLCFQSYRPHLDIRQNYKAYHSHATDKYKNTIITTYYKQRLVLMST